MLARQPYGGQSREGEVLGEVPNHPGECPLDRQSHDPQLADLLLRRLARLAQAEEIDPMAGVDQRIGLASDPWVGRVGRVHDDRDTAHCPFTSSQRASFSSAGRSARTRPRDMASASTRS